MSAYKYLNTGEAVRVIGEVKGLIAGYLQVEYTYGDEVVPGDGAAVLLRPAEVHDVPPTPMLDMQIAKLQQTVAMLEETIRRHRTELAKQEREREDHKRWRQQNKAWLDVDGIISGRITHRAEFSQWGRWNITDLRPKHGYTLDSILLQAKRHDTGWEWYWTAPRTRDFREKTQLFEGKAAAVAWIESKLATLDMSSIDLRVAKEIISKAQEDGIQCPARITEFVEAEEQKAHDTHMAKLRAEMEMLEKKGVK